MKKLILTALMAMATVGAFAQGTIKFATPVGTLVQTNNLGNVGNVTSSDNIHFSLYWGPTGSTEAQMQIISPTGPTNLFAVTAFGSGGRISVSTAFITGNATAPSGT